MANPAPDDWQQLAAQHRQAEFTSKVADISKRGRRGNRIFGGLLILFGLGVLAFGVYVCLQPGEIDDKRPLNLRGLLWTIGGGITTISTGVLIWRGTLTRR